jgi:hypothetical protein
MASKRAPVSLVVFALLAAPALAQQKAQIPQPQYQIDCRRLAIFAGNTSHAKLVKRFGAKNVTIEDVKRGEEAEEVNVTVLFAKDPTRRLEIQWLDPSGRTCPTNIEVSGEKNRWLAPYGVKIGMTIQDVEKRNGAPFKIHGFAFDYAGSTIFGESKLGRLPGRCSLHAYFEIEGGQPPDHLKKFIGEVEIDSNDKDLLTLKPKIRAYSIGFPPEC